jgi:hypothetical protein
MRLKNILNESTEASDIIKDLDKVRTDLIKKVDVLIAKKKKLYSDVDITTPMSADEKKLDKDIQDIFSQIQQIIQQKRKIKTESVNEGKYYVTYNLGRGRGKDLEKEFDQKTFKTTNKPKVFDSYNDAKKYAEKMEKMFQHSIGGGTAYWVSDEKMNPIKESINEEKVYIDFLNKAKGFKQDRIKFNSYEDAVKWARKNFDKFSPDMIKYESVVNEGRGIKSIQNDLNKTIAALESEISDYKSTKGTPQEKKHIDNLKKLHPIKKKLEAELEMAVSGLYRDAELKIED